MHYVSSLFSICILFQGSAILHVFTVFPLRWSSRSGNRLLCTHGWRNTSIDHCIFEPLEGCSFLHLGFLKFAKQFVLHSLQFHALLLKCADLISHFCSFDIHFMPGIGSLLLDEIVLLLQTLTLSLPDLLLAELSVIEVILPHAVQVMFNLFFLPSHFLDSRQLLVSEVFVSE